MKMTCVSTLVAAMPDRTHVCDPTPKQIEEATSIHAIAFCSHGDLLMVESEGAFDMDEWDAIADEASRVCRGGLGDSNDNNNDTRATVETGLEGFIKTTVGTKLVSEQNWRQSVK